MNAFSGRMISVIALSAMLFFGPAATGGAPVKMILDSDVVGDAGDPAAIACLHGLADHCEVEILAITSDVSFPYSAAVIDAINRYYGRPDIPVGTTRDPRQYNQSGYAEHIAKNWPNRYPDGIEGVPDAVEILREILSKQPDSSIVMVGIGHMTNWADLLKSQPDSFSPLNGTWLRRKSKSFLRWQPFSSRQVPGAPPSNSAHTTNPMSTRIYQPHNMWWKTGPRRSCSAVLKSGGRCGPMTV
jgi:hypothetical protein